MKFREKLYGDEGVNFVHWLIARLDLEGHPYNYWYDLFLNDVVIPNQQKKLSRGRSCFFAYNPSLKLCKELCRQREVCKDLSSKFPLRIRCLECSRTIKPGKKYCEYHYVLKQKNEKRIRQERIRLGKCVLCGNINDNKDKVAKAGRKVGKPLTTCSKCRDHIRDLQALKKRTVCEGERKGL